MTISQGAPDFFYDYGRVVLTFQASALPFETTSLAERWLKDRGFSVGRMQADEPRGVLHGAVDIRKWRDLSPLDREALHGLMTGDMRHGPVEIAIFADAPVAAREAIVAPPLDRASKPSPFWQGADAIGTSAAIGTLVCVAALCGCLFDQSPRPAPGGDKITLRADACDRASQEARR